MAANPTAIVNKILTYSLVDGPGNRMVIFLQGCNFACPACHNPYTIGTCNHCGDCLAACAAGALHMAAGKVVFDAEACDQCDKCLAACPISASPMTMRMSVADILAIARRHRAFLGGITVSGGEATLQLGFVTALFAALRADPELAHLSCFVDTNGHLGPRGWARLLPVTDGVMLDIKGFDAHLHRALSGRDNTKVLRAAKLVQAAGKLHELRFLAIPGKTDTAAEIAALIRFLAPFGTSIRLRLNAFRRHGVRGAARHWPVMDEAGIKRIEAALRRAGFDNIITPALYL